ncbi:hypothetical protein Tco_0303378 [Tanacetum coccineum]
MVDCGGESGDWFGGSAGGDVWGHGGCGEAVGDGRWGFGELAGGEITWSEWVVREDAAESPEVKDVGWCVWGECECGKVGGSGLPQGWLWWTVGDPPSFSLFCGVGGGRMEAGVVGGLVTWLRETWVGGWRRGSVGGGVVCAWVAVGVGWGGEGGVGVCRACVGMGGVGGCGLSRSGRGGVCITRVGGVGGWLGRWDWGAKQGMGGVWGIVGGLANMAVAWGDMYGVREMVYTGGGGWGQWVVEAYWGGSGVRIVGWVDGDCGWEDWVGWSGLGGLPDGSVRREQRDGGEGSGVVVLSRGGLGGVCAHGRWWGVRVGVWSVGDRLWADGEWGNCGLVGGRREVLALYVGGDGGEGGSAGGSVGSCDSVGFLRWGNGGWCEVGREVGGMGAWKLASVGSDVGGGGGKCVMVSSPLGCRQNAAPRGGRTGGQTGRGGGRTGKPTSRVGGQTGDQGGQGGNRGIGANRGDDEVPNFSTVIAQQLQDLLPTIIAREFIACNPKDYDGKGGAIVYTRWIEKMESVQDMSGCGANQKVKYTVGSFIDKALTWWNTQVQTRGREAAVGMTWEDFRDLMRKEFCPNNEIRKLETEF